MQLAERTFLIILRELNVCYCGQMKLLAPFSKLNEKVVSIPSFLRFPRSRGVPV